tara:strand:+ start:756 stop:998 length:243 start_codon:yes stop_codon:yes gene_type:complete
LILALIKDYSAHVTQSNSTNPADMTYETIGASMPDPDRPSDVRNAPGGWIGILFAVGLTLLVSFIALKGTKRANAREMGL